MKLEDDIRLDPAEPGIENGTPSIVVSDADHYAKRLV